MLLGFVIFLGWRSLPARLFNAPTSFVLLDRDGNLLDATIAADGQWRFPYTSKVPSKFITCITTFEDKRFYYHPGVDLAAIGRALVKNVRSGRVVQGGSTIDMQVIRLSRQHQRRSVWNKITEGWLALRMRFTYSKKGVMAMYAANAPFGGNVVGLEAAAWRYFGRGAEKLSWGETAALAVLPNAPSLVHPGKNRETLLRKRDRLLNQLYAAGKIDSGTCSLAKLEALPGAPLPLPRQAPHLLQRFKKSSRAANATTQITTTLDGQLQKRVAAIIQQHHAVLKGNGINNACALVLEVASGNVLAYVGNITDPGNPEMESEVDVVSAPRSPGSALKPILYAAALSDGLLLPNAILPDIPTQIGNYAPENFDRGYDGAVPAGKALSRSLNIPAVKLLQQYKYQRFYETLKQGGITTLNRNADHYGLSLILGGCEVTMWELTNLYAAMARSVNRQSGKQGKEDNADFFSGRYDASGEITYPSTLVNIQSAATGSPLDPTSCWFAFKAMQEVMRPGEEGLWQQFSSSQTIAWKTGTSFGFRDGWAIGVTPQHVVAVWVGNADGEGRPGLIGVHTAAPILFDIFRLLPRVPFFKQPVYNYSYVPVCRQSGYRANIDCAEVDTLFNPPRGDRSPLCAYHKIVNLDASGAYQVTAACESVFAMQHKSWFVLTPAMEYYYQQRNADYKLLPPFKAGCLSESTGRSIELIYPQEGAKIYVPLQLTGEKGHTVFTAAHRKAGGKIFWSLDDHFAGTTEHFHQLALAPAAGKHILTLVDENGARISRQFEILEKEVQR